jgi:HEAT repeat protein
VQQQPAPVNLEAAESLIYFHDVSGLSVIEDALMHAAQPGAISPPGGWGGLAACLDQITDPAAFPVLVHLLDSPDPDIRYGAIQGIRNFRTPDAIAPLIKGLDDPDPRVRQSSEWGLGLLLGGNPSKYGWFPPRYDSPATEHQTYLDSLRAWVKEWKSKTPDP